MRKPFLALLALAVLAGCSDPSEPREPSLTGTWSGTAQVGDATLTFWVTVVERDHSITGSGAMNFEPGFASSVTVNGTHVYPNLSFTGGGAGFPDFNYTGRFQNRNTIQGFLRGGGFDEQPFTFRRQD
jgi:hypothetical protein